MPATENDPITDVKLFHELPDDAPDELRVWVSSRDMAAYRFTTDDGRVAWGPVSTQLLTDSAVDAERSARELAIVALARILTPEVFEGTSEWHAREVEAQRQIAEMVA